METPATDTYNVGSVGSVAIDVTKQLSTETAKDDGLGESMLMKKPYSSIGNAFDPVGRPQISEYHLKDLNDLVLCIDAH
ncbi:hypothetical protein KIN20_029352 [Parelaphostrongylus tenuis]|uniref:Uncharacterized protein n=1 Tax=Parelaphostrongylus tenuis TaxID=148309 RepID=A0AAD5R2I8_PARTN|nr:hypothetical protein KIN20_029352 [Parelaphostrongylus tenuis]